MTGLFLWTEQVAYLQDAYRQGHPSVERLGMDGVLLPQADVQVHAPEDHFPKSDYGQCPCRLVRCSALVGAMRIRHRGTALAPFPANDPTCVPFIPTPL